ncbi:MAG: hypothetical protein ACR2JB_07495 [Bryobacteraceae bacterium]
MGRFSIKRLGVFVIMRIQSALDFGQCTQQLIDRKARPLPKPDEHHSISLDVGDLHDICKLHEF